MNIDDFIRESNRIEGIYRSPPTEEVAAYGRFLRLPNITVSDLEDFVAVIQPGARLRRSIYANVQVGDHIAPPGGPDIEPALVEILRSGATPFRVHVAYETLHPFTDGNGRSGRALWLRMMGGKAPLGFLHTFYYQTLGAIGR